MCMPDPALRQHTGFDSAVPSPCIRRCCLDDSDTCLGCFRTLDEIAAWGRSSDGARRHILVQSARRRKQRGSI
jgi:predicted Fe-S protein YdhL (DUF1289 family)